jgi:hypothetical protein
MKYINTLFAVIFFAPLLSLAAINLDEPNVLMAKAQQNRIALREVLLDIEINIPEMRDQPTFDKYFYMLNDLDKLATTLNLEEIYPKMVDRLGLRMVNIGARWLDVTTDTPVKLQYYFKWMDANALNHFLEVTNYDISLIKDKSLLAVMVQNIEIVLPIVDAQSDDQPQIMLGYRRLIADTVIRILRDSNLSDAEVSFWVGKLNLPASISEYLDTLNQKIYALNFLNKQEAHEYLNRILLLAAKVETFKGTAPSWLARSVSDSFVELFLRSVQLELALDQQKVAEAIGTLDIRSTLSLMQQWAANEKPPTESYSDIYLAYAREIVLHGRVLSMNKETDDFEKWLSRAIVPILGKKLDLEGNYTLLDDKGKKWFFTIAYARENMLVAAMGDEASAVYKSFYNITYNTTLNSFVASERESDLDLAQNPPIKFTVVQGKITIIDPFVRFGSMIYKGQKDQNFADMWNGFVGPIGAIDGIYEGEVYIRSTPKKIKLIVTSFGGYTLGRLDSLDMGIAIDFNIGTKATDGILILTSGRNTNGGTWMQIRGHITPDGLKASVIVGGKANSPKVTFLKRIN